MFNKIKRFSFLTTFLALPAILAGCDGPNLFELAQERFFSGICITLIIILDIIAIFEVLNSSRSAGTKVLWTLFLICCPILGFVIYYFFADR